jgi:putative DNA modification/repair radical SAM protein
MDLQEKLSILADAAKYDASCVSSGSQKKDSRFGKGIGSTGPDGICHSFTPDGRCVSLLKILLTNFCTYDCLYCINRKSSDVRRARFTPEEVVSLTLEFYKRNYIEGLFLSSGIIRNPDYTMEQLVRVAKELRLTHDFRGYIHLKTIPEASFALIEEAGRYADRLSINVELPTQSELDALAPEKNVGRIKRAMTQISERIQEAATETAKSASAPPFIPAGQSTQMVVGATSASDHTILVQASSLYQVQKLKRVYYSAYSPIPAASTKLPAALPPLLREHRLYQADWLMRFYGFKAEEIVTTTSPNLSLAVDPKTHWALQNKERFPLDLNVASKEEMLRVPGLGARNVERLRFEDLVRLKVNLKKALPFVLVQDYRPSLKLETANVSYFSEHAEGEQLELSSMQLS